MKKLLLNIVCICAPLLGFSQVTIDLNSENPFVRVFNTDQKARYEGITGNPFIVKDWTVGKTYTVKGESKEEYTLLYDMIEDALLTKEGDKLMKFGNDVIAFTLKDLNTGSYRMFSRGYMATKDTDAATFFEELASGTKLTLLKYVKKKIASSRNYDGSESKSIEEINRYYFSMGKDKPLALVKLDKNEFLAAMSDKKAEMEVYIAKEKLNLKKAEDAAKAVTHYNSL